MEHGARIWVLLGQALALACLGCIAPRGETPEAPRYPFEHAAMGTVWRAVIVGDADVLRAQRAAIAAFDRVEAIESALSDYDEGSEVRVLCEAPHGVWYPVSEDLYRALEVALEVGRASGGAFDVTLGPCTRLWRRTARQGSLPDPERMAEARRRCDPAAVHLRRDPSGVGQVRLDRPGMRLDFGGIGKGLALDAALDELEAHGYPMSLVDGGGDLALGAPPPGQEGWRVEVRGLDPQAAPELLTLAWCAVATSGDEEQFVEVDGVRYGHLLDPATGLGLTGPRRATVIAYRGDLADAWATVLCVDPARLADLPPGVAGRTWPAGGRSAGWDAGAAAQCGP